VKLLDSLCVYAIQLGMGTVLGKK